MGMDVVRVHKINLGRCLRKKMASRILKIYSDFKVTTCPGLKRLFVFFEIFWLTRMCAPHSVSVKVWQVSLSLLISFADGETNCSWLSVLPRCINSQSSARRADIFFFFNWCLLFTRTGTSSKRRDCTLSEKSVEQKVISLFKLSHKVHTNYTGRSYALSYRIGRNYYVTWHVTLLTYISFLMYIFLSQANWDEHCTNVSSALHDVLKASQWESKAVPPDHLQVMSQPINFQNLLPNSSFLQSNVLTGQDGVLSRESALTVWSDCEFSFPFRWMMYDITRRGYM